MGLQGTNPVPLPADLVKAEEMASHRVTILRAEADRLGRQTAEQQTAILSLNDEIAALSDAQKGLSEQVNGLRASVEQFNAKKAEAEQSLVEAEAKLKEAKAAEAEALAKAEEKKKALEVFQEKLSELKAGHEAKDLVLSAREQSLKEVSEYITSKLA